MAALPSIRYRDPAEWLEAVEAMSCKGCIYSRKEIIFGETFETCSKDRKHGTRCTHYEEREPVKL